VQHGAAVSLVNKLQAMTANSATINDPNFEILAIPSPPVPYVLPVRKPLRLIYDPFFDSILDDTNTIDLKLHLIPRLEPGPWPW
jgi:hypothetical protein